MSFYDTPLADLDAASAHDPGWALPHVMRAGFLLSLTEASMLAEAAAAPAGRARAAAHGAPPRERAHLDAVQAVAEGRWQAACRIWDELLVEYPRDALALQWSQLWDFYRGDAVNLRARPARALPEWDEADPLYAHVLSLYAFGLEESNLYPQAEEAGRRALALNPKVPWAVHAVAHVMEMQGRFEEGAAWLRQHQAEWAEGNGFAGHLWWHKGLFRLEALDIAGVLRAGRQAPDRRQPADHAAARRCGGAAVAAAPAGRRRGARCAALVEGWDLSDAGGRLLRLQRRACGAGAARRRRGGARRSLGGALRRARDGRRRRAAQQPRHGARGRPAADARAAGLRARRGRRRGRRRCTRRAAWRSASAAAMRSAT